MTKPFNCRPINSLPDLRALDVFVTVCNTGSMALAAQRLSMSQSAVSQMIKALEYDCGTQLLDREVRPAPPTRAGHVLLELANDLLSDARVLTDKMRTMSRQDYQHMRLGCVDSFAATIGPELIRALSGSAREIAMWSGLTPALSAQLQGRELDMAICTDTQIKDPRIRQRALFSEAWVAVFPRRHALRKLTTARELGSVLGTLPLVRYSQRSVIGQQIERFLLHIGIQAGRRFEFDATDPLLSMVSAGLGWALSTPLCLWQARHYLDKVTVLPLPASGLGRRNFFLLSRPQECGGLDDEIARMTQWVLEHDVGPAIHSVMPGLPADVLAPQQAP
jgi:DNA-binding transcriptional LysR family regulator